MGVSMEDDNDADQETEGSHGEEDISVDQSRNNKIRFICLW